MVAGKFVIVGLGRVGFRLLQLLSKDLHLTCIDPSEEALQAARQLRGEGFTTIQGDATSRLVLETAGAGQADTVVITTTTEKINLEVARVLRAHFDIPRIIAVGITPKGIEELEQLDIEVENIFNISATGLRNRLEQKAKTVQGIGLGKNEILEVEVHPNSRLANKPLAALNPRSWRIGIVYRDGNIIIPTGDTILRPKDKTVLLGEPNVIKTVADLLTFRFRHFPLEYGDTLVALIPAQPKQSFLDELAYLLSVFPLEKGLLLLQRRTAELEQTLQTLAEQHRISHFELLDLPGRDPLEGCQQILSQRGRTTALMVLPRETLFPALFSAATSRRSKGFLRRLAGEIGCPILLAQGSHPYEKVAVPGFNRNGLQQSLETTLEMSLTINYSVSALLVRLSKYIASDEEGRLFDTMKKTAADLGLMYKTSVRTSELEDNPITAIVAAAREQNLLVTEIDSWSHRGWLSTLFRPDVAWSVVRRNPVSTLLIPPVEVMP